jgi:hypothetical protein
MIIQKEKESLTAEEFEKLQRIRTSLLFSKTVKGKAIHELLHAITAIDIEIADSAIKHLEKASKIITKGKVR